MTEEFMTLETAKLLKEKGFDLPVETVFNFDDNSPQQFKLRVNYNNFPSFYSRPSQFLAQKWLRETKNLHITIYNSASGYTYDISKADMGTVLYCFPEGPNDGGNWDTYEEALEAGIIKALKLI